MIFFSHLADFTPVYTTEFMTFASMQPEFEKLNRKLLGLSIDSTYSHIAWLRTIKEKIEFKNMKGVDVTFPVISALTMEEDKRLLVAMQFSDQHKVATPANRQPGEDVIVPPPGSCGVVKERVETPAADTTVLDWFIVLKKFPK